MTCDASDILSVKPVMLLQGDTIASVDSYGVVKLFDVRTVAPMTTIDCGPHPANRVSFDPSSKPLPPHSALSQV